MSTLAITSAIELGLFYGIMTLGIFISYRILDIPDLTVDGSFTLGAGVSAMLSLAGYPALGILFGFLAGGLAGVVTAILQTKLKVQPILAGILTMTGLYSINIMVMGGKPNLPLTKSGVIFSRIEEVLQFSLAPMVVGIIFVMIVVILVVAFLYTRLGLAIRATGDNPEMVSASSINVNMTKVIGLALANALVGLSGALLAQYQCFADVSMGVGMVVMGIASLIIGEVIFGKKSIGRNAIAAVVGSIIYRLIIGAAFEINISASSMKLITAIIVALAISYPAIKEQIHLNKRKKRGAYHA
ncbi:MAG: ABC transporter permease [Cellulosilyticaceae bacterium]